MSTDSINAENQVKLSSNPSSQDYTWEDTVKYAAFESGLQDAINKAPAGSNTLANLTEMMTIVTNKFDGHSPFAHFQDFLQSPSEGFTINGKKYVAAVDLFFYFPNASTSDISTIYSLAQLGTPVLTQDDQILMNLQATIDNPPSGFTAEDVQWYGDAHNAFLHEVNKQDTTVDPIAWLQQTLQADPNNDNDDIWSHLSSDAVRNQFSADTTFPVPPQITAATFTANLNSWIARDPDTSEGPATTNLLNAFTGSGLSIAQFFASLANEDIFTKYPGLTVDAVSAIYNSAGITPPDLTVAQMIEAQCEGLGNPLNIANPNVLPLTSDDQQIMQGLALYLGAHTDMSFADIKTYFDGIVSAGTYENHTLSATGALYLQWLVNETSQPSPFSETGGTFKNDGRGGGEIIPPGTAGVENVVPTGGDENTAGSERLVSIGSDYYVTDDHYTTFFDISGIFGNSNLTDTDILNDVNSDKTNPDGTVNPYHYEALEAFSRMTGGISESALETGNLSAADLQKLDYLMGNYQEDYFAPQG